MNEQALFIAALQYDPSGRHDFLEGACGGDDTLRRRVDRLLAAYDQAGSFLDNPAAVPNNPGSEGSTGTFAPDAASAEDTGATADLPGRDEHLGAILGGKYKLIEEIGEGGMGSVFMAQQTEPVKRAVAVKVIKAGMDSKAVLARFEAERQALAMMDHPNIAKVLDAGTTESGRPFFVMELVKGVPITQFCDERKHTPRQRLEMFVPVCNAIQHAHQKGVIHRDIKPSNVLVAMYDDQAVPKVIDFGVAKAAGQSLTDKTLMTGFGAVVGTPEYMSPEQANLNNLDIDTRSDVYSLGVLLYELLTGTTPVDRKSLGKAALLEVLRIVREVEAPKPSAKLSTADALPSLSANRGTEPKKLTGLLRNELDWIVMKALEKDRTRRYETANGFAADVQRYLTGEAVQAHPPSTAYRVKKFVRRHKGQVIAASLVLLALVAGIAGTTVGLFEAKKQERLAVAAQYAEAERAEGERLAKLEAQANEKLAGERFVQVEAEKKRADEEKQVAQAVKDFLQKKLLAQADTRAQVDTLLKAGGPTAEAKLNPTIHELLDRAAQELAPDKIEANFPNQPLVQAELLQTVGLAYDGIGDEGIGLPLLVRSWELFKTHVGPDHPKTLASMNNLAKCYHAAGKIDKALPLLEETLKLRKAKFGPDHPDTLTCMSNLGVVYTDAREMSKALPLLEETLKLQKAKLGPDHPDTLATMTNLAGAYVRAGKLEAVPLLEETLTLTKAKLGPDHPDTLVSMHNLAALYRVVDKLDLSQRLLEESLKVMKSKLRADHPDTIAIMSNLSEVYLEAKKYDLALPLCEEVYKLEKAKFGPDHPRLLRSMRNLAVSYLFTGKYELALPLLEETLKLEKAKLGPDHLETVGSMTNLALCYLSLKQLDKSVPLFEEVLLQKEKKLGRDHSSTLSTVAALGENYKQAGRLKEAIPLLEEAYRASKTHTSLRWVSTSLSDAYAKAGKVDLALTLWSEVSAANPKNTALTLQVAALQVWFGEDKEYAETVSRALRFAKDTQDAATAERTAKLVSLHPGDDRASRDACLVLGNKAVELGKDNPHIGYFQMALGMAQYRSGLFAEADATFATLAAKEKNNKHIAHTVGFYRAMAMFRLGKSHEANQLATATTVAMRPLPIDNRNPLADGANADDIIIWLAYKEAKGLINFDAIPREVAPSPRVKK